MAESVAGCGAGSVAQEAERVQDALVQRHLEPDFEHREEDGGDRERESTLLTRGNLPRMIMKPAM
jgi:hypothetical protein